MILDKIGQELNSGDLVIYISKRGYRGGSDLEIGMIERLTAKTAFFKHNKSTARNRSHTDKVIKISPGMIKSLDRFEAGEDELNIIRRRVKMDNFRNG